MQINITKIRVAQFNGVSKVWMETDLPNILNLDEEYIKTHPYSLFGVMSNKDVLSTINTIFKGIPVEYKNYQEDPTNYDIWDVTMTRKLKPRG